MTIPRDGKFVWVTWLSKLMVGEVSCEWAPWFRSTYQNWDRPPSDFDEAAWQAAHTRLMRDVRTARRGDDERLLVERQVQFYYQRPSGLTLSGRPDLAAINGDSALIIDAKTGQQRASDAAQVKIYMYCLPRSHALFRGKELSGKVVYQDHEINISPDSVVGEFEDQFNYWLDVLESSDPPLRVPSPGECRFCNIGLADCPERMADAAISGDY